MIYGGNSRAIIGGSHIEGGNELQIKNEVVMVYGIR